MAPQQPPHCPISPQSDQQHSTQPAAEDTQKQTEGAGIAHSVTCDRSDATAAAPPPEVAGCNGSLEQHQPEQLQGARVLEHFLVYDSDLLGGKQHV